MWMEYYYTSDVYTTKKKHTLLKSHPSLTVPESVCVANQHGEHSRRQIPGGVDGTHAIRAHGPNDSHDQESDVEAAKIIMSRRCY